MWTLFSGLVVVSPRVPHEAAVTLVCCWPRLEAGSRCVDLLSGLLVSPRVPHRLLQLPPCPWDGRRGSQCVDLFSGLVMPPCVPHEAVTLVW